MPVAKAGQCPKCGKGRLVRDSEQRTWTYRGRTITYSVTGATCVHCGKRYIGPSGAGAAGDQVRAREVVINARERRQKRPAPEPAYQSEEEFFTEVARDAQRFRAGKQMRPVATVSADPSLRASKK